MEQVAEERGMSKGCLIGLIVGGVLLLMCIAAGITCYMKRDDLMKFGVRTMVTGTKTELNKNSYGMDTVSVNRYFDAFATKVDSIQMEDPSAQQFFQTISDIAGDGKVTEAEAKQLMEAMATLYPELRPSMPAPTMPDTTVIMTPSAADSTAQQSVDSVTQPH